MTNLMTRKKKYKFSIDLYLEKLSSVPFINGLLYAKLRLHDGSYQISSPREEVLDHSVKWGSKFDFTCKLRANASNGVLESSLLRISIRKEVKGGRSSVKLGFVDLDLAEFAGAGLTSKRSLLEGYNSKNHRQDNSMLEIKIEMSLISGDPLFKRPQTQQQLEPVTDSAPDPPSSGLPPPVRLNFNSKTPCHVDTEDIIDQLVQTNLDLRATEPSESEDVGLQLYVGKDGTATLGSRSGTGERKKQKKDRSQPYSYP